MSDEQQPQQEEPAVLGAEDSADGGKEAAPAEPSAAPTVDAVAAAAAVAAQAPPEPAAPVLDAPAVAPSTGGGEGGDDDEDDDEDKAQTGGGTEKKAGRRKINIEFIEDKSRRHITFSKRKAGIMNKAYELSALTGTQVLLLVASETGHVYTYATEKLQPLIQKPEGKNLIQTCLSAPDHQAIEAGRPNPGADANQYAAMAAAAAAAQQAAAAAAVGERPAKARKLTPGAPPMGIPGMPTGVPGMNPYARGGLSMGIPALAAQGARAGLPFGLDGRSLPGMPSPLPGMPGAAQLQGLSPALLQGLMSGQLPSPSMMGMDGAFGGGGNVKLDALQQTIADAAANASMQSHRDM